MELAARAVRVSGNKKLGGAAATYAAQSSCPTTCALRGAGCYAEGGRVAFTTRRVNGAGADLSPEDVARVEAEQIDTLPGWAPLRLHIVGDCATPDAARIVAEACDRYTRRGGGRAWTYSHAWRDVPRGSWGAVSVLASVESLSDAREALAAGYAPAMVVADHPSDGRAEVREGVRLIPCPEQTRGVTCADCRLCWSADDLRDRGAAITFAAHGARARTVREVIGE